MRFPAIRFRRTLTLRSLMIVVALVAIGFAGWNVRMRWLICMQEAWILGIMADGMRDSAKGNQESAEYSVESVKSYERLLGDPPDYEREWKELQEMDHDAASRPEDAATIRTIKAEFLESKEWRVKMMHDNEKRLKQERADIVRYRRQAAHDAASVEVWEGFERRYRRAAWRPWIDTRPLKHDVSKFFEVERRFQETTSKPPNILPEPPSDSAVRPLKSGTTGPMSETTPPNPAPSLR